MERRKLGRSGLEVSALGPGCMGMSFGCGAAAIDLAPDDLRDIEAAASAIKIHGDRYPENLMRMTGR